MDIQYSIGIRLAQDGMRFFGPGPAQLLRLVRAHHSLHKAAAVMQMSYSKAWRLIGGIERAIGCPVLLRSRGGSDGGGSILTDEGEALLRAYELFCARIEEEAQKQFAECFGANWKNQKK